MPRKTPRKRPRPLLALLSRKKSLYSTRRLVESARARGMRTRVVDVLACNLVLEAGRPRVFVAGEELRDVAVAVPRIGASVTAAGLAVVRQLEALGVPVVNGAAGIANSRDKLRALQLLAQAEVESILSTLWDLGQEILLQEFIAESRGRDVRALVVGDRVAGAMRREARSGEFRSNLHRGGEGSALELSPDYAEAAVHAARVLGLDVAGVDLLEAEAGPKVMEVNSSPGFEGLERATGLDIAGAIVEYAARLAARVSRAAGA